MPRDTQPLCYIRRVSLEGLRLYEKTRNATTPWHPLSNELLTSFLVLSFWFAFNKARLFFCYLLNTEKSGDIISKARLVNACNIPQISTCHIEKKKTLKANFHLFSSIIKTGLTRHWYQIVTDGQLVLRTLSYKF